MFHDDVMKWKRFPRYWPFVWGIHRSPVNSPHKGQWRGAFIMLMFPWSAGDFRRHRAHYDVIVMFDNLPGKPSIKVHNRVTWGKTPTLRHEAQISITNGWSSLKLLYDQTFVNFLVCIYFLGKIYDIVEIKQNDYFWPKMGALPHMWAKRPTLGAKRQPMGILPGQDDYNVELSFRINWLQCGLDLY